MNRRTVFSIAAGAMAAAGVLWVGGMAAAHAIEAHPTTVSVIRANADGTGSPTPEPTGTAAADPTPAASPDPGSTTAASAGDDSDFVPFADRLRAWRPGDEVITLAQILAFYDKPGRLSGGDPTWYQEKAITAQCMADKGWYYDPRSDGRQDAPHRNDPRPPVDPQAQLALGGNTGAGDAYRWQDAGCYGLAVHETGNDHNN